MHAQTSWFSFYLYSAFNRIKHALQFYAIHEFPDTILNHHRLLPNTISHKTALRKA